MTGKQIKRFFRTKQGVVVFEGYTIRFVSIPGLKTNIYSDLNAEPTEKRILITTGLRQVKKLDNNKTYDVEVGMWSLTFKDIETGKVELEITGIRY